MMQEAIKESIIGAGILIICVIVIISYILAPTSILDDRTLLYILRFVGIKI